jgi:predicted GNAT family N-acyltransferase
MLSDCETRVDLGDGSLLWSSMSDSLDEDASFDGLKLVEPRSEADWAGYFDLRWRVLRAPWGEARGSERDESDASSYHLMFRGPEGLAVAVGRIHLNSPQEAQVRYMAVDDSCRGKGLGGRILAGLEAFARAKGAKEIVLNAREQAVPFYVRHGYREEGLANILFGEVQHVRMRKRL